MTEKWGWYNTLYQLADKKLGKFEDVTKMNMEECLTFMCYKQDINEIEKKQIQQQINASRQY